MTQQPAASRGVEISLAKPDEYAALGALAVAAYAPSGMAASEPYFDRLADIATRAREAEVWAARLEGRPVGTVTWCTPGSPLVEIATEGEGESRMLAVAPDAQGHGVGRALVEACIARARADGDAALVLSTARWMTTAHRLYESLGFVRTPERDWAPRPGVDLLTYRLDLVAR